MPADTINTGLPYPLGPDRINVAGDMKRLADDIPVGHQGTLVAYARTPSRFYIYAGGVHSDTVGDPGGGKERMHISATGSCIIGAAMESVTPLILIGPEGHERIEYHAEGTGFGTRSAWIGFPGGADLDVFDVMNERATGNLRLRTINGGGVIQMWPNDVKVVEVNNDGGGSLHVGPYSLTTAGSAVRADGAFISNVIAGAITTCNVNLQRGAVPGGVGGIFARFARTAGTNPDAAVQIGSITVAAGGSSVVYNTTSDRRMKEDRGLIEGAIERLKQLMPRRFVWLTDDEHTEMDGFFADEVTPAVPEAVQGEPDATLEDGSINPQQLNLPSLIPLLTAALKEAVGRIEVLEARLGGA